MAPKSKSQQKMCAVEAKRGTCSAAKCPFQHKPVPVPVPAPAAAAGAGAAAVAVAAPVVAVAPPPPVRGIVQVVSPLAVKCIECNDPFEIPLGEAIFYKEQGWKQPVRCLFCRGQHSAAHNAGPPVYGGKLVPPPAVAVTAKK